MNYWWSLALINISFELTESMNNRWIICRYMTHKWILLLDALKRIGIILPTLPSQFENSTISVDVKKRISEKKDFRCSIFIVQKSTMTILPRKIFHTAETRIKWTYSEWTFCRKPWYQFEDNILVVDYNKKIGNCYSLLYFNDVSGIFTVILV